MDQKTLETLDSADLAEAIEAINFRLEFARNLQPKQITRLCETRRVLYRRSIIVLAWELARGGRVSA